jgi:hypothetical protein
MCTVTATNSNIASKQREAARQAKPAKRWRNVNMKKRIAMTLALMMVLACACVLGTALPSGTAKAAPATKVTVYDQSSDSSVVLDGTNNNAISGVSFDANTGVLTLRNYHDVNAEIQGMIGATGGDLTKKSTAHAQSRVCLLKIMTQLC